MENRISLARVSAELRAKGYRPPSYDRLYRATLAAAFPAQQADNGRWSVAREDLDQIASALGLSADDRVAA